MRGDIRDANNITHHGLPMTMTKVGTAIELYRVGGVRAVFDTIRDKALQGEWTPTVKRLIGKRLHHKLYMYGRLGYWPQIKNPRTFNEKIIYRKLYTDKDIFSVVEDKWLVRDYVADKVGEDILPELYYVTEKPETIPFQDFPDKYVIKPNHLSGGKNFIIDESTSPDEQAIQDKCKEWLNQTYGQIKEEYWYADIEAKILVEEYIDSKNSKAPIDYKFLIFHGEVKVIHATYNRFDDEETKRNFYDRDWNPIDVKLHFPKGEGVPKPENLDGMIQIAEKLGKGFDHIRVDLYSPGETEIFFGEMTVAESSGGNPFEPRCYDFEFGSYW